MRCCIRSCLPACPLPPQFATRGPMKDQAGRPLAQDGSNTHGLKCAILSVSLLKTQPPYSRSFLTQKLPYSKHSCLRSLAELGPRWRCLPRVDGLAEPGPLISSVQATCSAHRCCPKELCNRCRQRRLGRSTCLSPKAVEPAAAYKERRQCAHGAPSPQRQ